MARAKQVLEWTNEWVSTLQPDPAKRVEKPDPTHPGLRVIVQPNGKISFAIRYTNTAGDYVKATLGRWPQMRLVEDPMARQARMKRAPESDPPDAFGLYDLLMARKKSGEADPCEYLESRKAAAKAKREQAEREADFYLVKNRFQKFLDRPHKKTGKAKRASSRKRYEGIFAPLLAKWGERDVRTIGKPDCEDALIEAGKRGDHAKASTFMLLNGFFAWLEKHDTIPKSPMKSFDRIAADSNRERTLTDEELKLVWQACDELTVFGRLVRLLILTGQRRTEVASMRFSEINFAEKYWEIPGDVAKNEMPHVVYLSDAAMKIIEGAPRIQGNDFVFKDKGPSHFKGYSKGKAALDKLAPTSKPWTLHDLRRTVSTRFARDQICSLVVAEKVLNHGKGVLGGVAGDYNKYEYADERRAAMDAWALKVGRIVNPVAANVVELRQPEVVA